MSFRVGVDVGSVTTSWTVALVDDDRRHLVTSGRMPSVVVPVATGVAAGSEAPADASDTITGFVDRLGDADPIMVGGVPYGVESLVGAQLAAVMRTASAAAGAVFDFVVVAHTDGLDDYHVGLWREAARVAGVPMIATVTVEASVATATLDAYGLAAAPDDVLSAGASVVRLATDRDPVPAIGVEIIDIAATAGAAAAVTAVVAGVLPAGETVSAIGPTVGPTGVPLAPSGPSGVSVGPSGTPLPPAGPSGTPIEVASAAPPAMVPHEPPRKGWKLLRGRRAMLAAGAAAVVVVGTVGLVRATRGGDDGPSGGATATTATAAVVTSTPPGGTASTDTTAENTPTVPVSGVTVPSTTSPATLPPAVIDVTPLLGQWRDLCDPFVAGDGASAQIETITSPGPGLVDLVIEGADYGSTDCSDPPAVGITVTVQMEVTGEGTVDGVRAFSTTLLGEPTCTDDVGGAACGFAMNGFDGVTDFALGIDDAGLLRFAAGMGSAGIPTGWRPLGDGATRL